MLVNFVFNGGTLRFSPSTVTIITFLLKNPRALSVVR